MIKYGIIYKITNNINNKVYIGQTTKKNGFDDRYGSGVEKNSHNIHLKRSISKYGIDNFKIDKELDCAYSLEELNEKEIEYIKYYHSNDPKYGYNIRSGGDNTGKIKGKYKADILIRQGLSVFCKNTCEIFLSVKDASEKYNIGRISIKHQCEGNKHRKEKFYNKELNEYMEFEYYDVENKELKKGHKKIPVICVTTGERFVSVAEASRYFGIDGNTLGSLLRRNKKKTTRNNVLEFMYLYDYIIEYYGEMFSLDNSIATI